MDDDGSSNNNATNLVQLSASVFFSDLAVNCRCINFIFNMGDKPVKPLYYVDCWKY